MHLYHILVNERGESIFAQREAWGEYSVRMHALLTGDVKTVPGHRDVYYSFWNPANPIASLPPGHILFFVEAENLVEAIASVAAVWWSLDNIEDLQRPIMMSGTRNRVSNNQYQQLLDTGVKRKVS